MKLIILSEKLKTNVVTYVCWECLLPTTSVYAFCNTNHGCQ